MTQFNFTRNQQLALLVIIGITLLGLAWGKIRDSRPVALQESILTVSEQASGGNMEVLAPTGDSYRPREELPALMVHVSGCVKNPSVYKLQPESRIVDAVHAAGGPTADANLDAINLAAKIRDGEKVQVPSKQAAMVPPTAMLSSSPRGTTRSSSSGPTTPALGMVNINTAGMDQLDALPGVGPATAQKIIEYRNQIGRFTSVDQLLEVKGIGPKKLEQMRAYVAL